MKQLVRLIATGLYSGYFPIVSGTIGTIPAWIIAWFWLGRDNFYLLIAAILTLFLSVWSAGKSEEFLGHDSKRIVIDEWAGMFVSLLFLPFRLDVYVAAFLFFRFYDVIKPYPAGRCESLPGGLGVTLDDIFAGVYANATCWLCIYFLGQMGWFGF
jgi:phosphatidylglycerophosphatase A